MSPRVPLLSAAIKDLTTSTTRELQELSGARSPGLLKAAQVLRKGWRRVLSVAGAGKPSAPGDSPRKQSGRLARSVKQGLTETGRKVAVTWFTAPILEGGADTALPTRPSRRGRRRRQGRYADGRKVLRIAPRPSASKALAASRAEMDQAMATGITGSLDTLGSSAGP